MVRAPRTPVPPRARPRVLWAEPLSRSAGCRLTPPAARPRPRRPRPLTAAYPHNHRRQLLCRAAYAGLHVLLLALDGQRSPRARPQRHGGQGRWPVPPFWLQLHRRCMQGSWQGGYSKRRDPTWTPGVPGQDGTLEISWANTQWGKLRPREGQRFVHIHTAHI